MTPDEKRIAIAEECPNLWHERGFIWSDQGHLVHPYGLLVIDPLNDLNAMHEAEKALTVDQRLSFTRRLCRLLGVSSSEFSFVHATAAQRADALLMVKGRI